MEFVTDVTLLRIESVRLDTFHCWSIVCPIRPKELARQGFYFAGENDSVICNFCKGQLNTWVAGDVVSTEHSKWYPDCPFVQGKDCGNIPMMDTHIEHPPYIMFYDRMESFQRWHKIKNLSPDRMASAGFFQITPFDHVKCFSCGVRLNKWMPDNDPWQEHKKFSPDCSFLKERYGSYLGFDVMEQLTALTNLEISHRKRTMTIPQQETGYQATEERIEPELTMLQTNNDENYTLYASAMPNPKSELSGPSQAKATGNKDFSKGLDKLGLEELKQIILEQEDERLCKICFEQKINVIFQPCNHTVCCSECGEQQRLCPICRSKIEKVNHIYFS